MGRVSARRRAAFAGCLLAGLAAVVLASVASGHIERSSYWPDPAPDTSVSPPAGGQVPAERTLASALKRKPPGVTRVVCQKGSLKRLRREVKQARKHGFDVRPSDHQKLTRKRAKFLRRINKKLARRCRFHSIQAAVNASGNNDRVVVMPGIYTEPKSRSQPTNDPSCAQYKVTNDQGAAAVSYAYQFHCPNDQNLIAVLGREPGPNPPPSPPPDNRHGIPDLGPCIRCNMQLEGSGPSADDVVVDAGQVSSGNGPPANPVKDVGIRIDRADGFVLRDLTVRHAKEHDIYILESDGYHFDNFKTYYAGEYGVLTFVEDHGLMENCDAAGNGDSGLYPGAGADTGAERDTSYYPQFRYSQEIRNCDSHHNLAGYSGTDGNATHIDHNNFYDNALGFTTDVFTAPGHPGFPQDSDLVENNNFYDNNFNPYVKGSDVVPAEPEPVGTGLWIAGGNDNVIRNNYFWNNWRRGVMIFAVPDQFVCGPSGGYVPGCNASSPTSSTSYNNQVYGNVMGVSPGGTVQPNGTDFWWDSYPGNTGNCWYSNRAAPGRQVTDNAAPLGLPNCSNGTNPGSSMGTGNPAAESELLSCFGAFETGSYDPNACSWFTTPAKPRTAAAASQRHRQARAIRRLLSDPAARAQVCAAYRGRHVAACSKN